MGDAMVISDFIATIEDIIRETEWRFYAAVFSALLTFVLTQISLFVVRRNDSKRAVRSDLPPGSSLAVM